MISSNTNVLFVYQNFMEWFSLKITYIVKHVGYENCMISVLSIFIIIKVPRWVDRNADILSHPGP